MCINAHRNIVSADYTCVPDVRCLRADPLRAGVADGAGPAGGVVRSLRGGGSVNMSVREGRQSCASVWA